MRALPSLVGPGIFCPLLGIPTARPAETACPVRGLGASGWARPTSFARGRGLACPRATSAWSGSDGPRGWVSHARGWCHTGAKRWRWPSPAVPCKEERWQGVRPSWAAMVAQGYLYADVQGVVGWGCRFRDIYIEWPERAEVASTLSHF